MNVNYTSILPQARFILNNIPSLYNPLYSTFISRVEHRDGGYDYNGPVFYSDTEEHVRKVLLQKSDRPEALLNAVFFEDDASRIYFENQVTELTGDSEEYMYINIPRQYSITQIKVPYYHLGDSILFSSDSNPALYFPLGLYNPEGDFAWSSGNETLFNVRFDEPISSNLNLNMTFNIFGGNTGSQSVKIYAADHPVADHTFSYTEDWQTATFTIPSSAVDQYGVLRLRFEFPDAVSPNDVDGSPDPRILAMRFKEISITKA
jgi:hypothetical protein